MYSNAASRFVVYRLYYIEECAIELFLTPPKLLSWRHTELCQIPFCTIEMIMWFLSFSVLICVIYLLIYICWTNLAFLDDHLVIIYYLLNMFPNLISKYFFENFLYLCSFKKLVCSFLFWLSSPWYCHQKKTGFIERMCVVVILHFLFYGTS